MFGHAAGMRLSTITHTAYVTTVVLSMITGATMLMASAALDEERAAVANRYAFDKASFELDVEIFHMSDKAREYVITGNEEYLEDYGVVAAALQDTEDRLQHMEDAGATEVELATLTEAIDQANRLTNDQRQAIEAFQSGDAEAARDILFSDHYEAELDLINSDVLRFQALLDQRTATEIEQAIRASRVWKTISEIVLGLTALMFLGVLYFVLKRRILRPVSRLSDVVTRLADQDYDVDLSNFHNRDEIGDMAKAVRIFRENGLERRRLEEKLERDLKLKTVLSRMTHRMQACESKDEVADVVRLFLPAILPGCPGRLYLFEKTDNIMRQASEWLAPADSAARFGPMDCWALRRGTLHQHGADQPDMPCEHLRSAEGGPESGRESANAVSSVCVPLTAQREVIGLLYCEMPDEPAYRAHEHYIVMLAENISLSLANMGLREELQEQAMADSLTGLANRRQLEQRLGALLGDSQHTDRRVSCIMMDVDHFKMLNDTYGHDKGDDVLREIARILQSHTREDGLAFRYGGEEFVILLPGVETEDALLRAEAIRSDIAAHRFHHDGIVIDGVTASFGVSTSPDICPDTRLVPTADAALYESKANGRNRVTRGRMASSADKVA